MAKIKNYRQMGSNPKPNSLEYGVLAVTKSGNMYVGDQNNVPQLLASGESALSEATKALYKLPSDATTDDAFFAAYMGAGKYAFKLTVLLPNGTPADNVLVNGLSTPLGNSVRTDANGKCLGVSSSSYVTISIPFTEIIGIAPFSKTVSATYAVTNLTLTASVDQTKAKTITTSGTYRLYNGISTWDGALIGGGGGGREFGGEGGNILNAYNKAVLPTLQVSIGAGGTGGFIGNVSDQSPTNGGDTKITNLNLTALGGKASTYYGSSNGGAGGESNSSSRKNGGNRTEYPFGDSSIPCSGGGAGGESNNAGKAGTPGSSYGGSGGIPNSQPAGNGKGFGGGGGGSNHYQDGSKHTYDQGGNGYQGCVMLRWRYK